MKKVLILLTVVIVNLGLSVELVFEPSDFTKKNTITKSIEKNKSDINKSELSLTEKYELELFKLDNEISRLKRENQKYKKFVTELKSLLKKF